MILLCLKELRTFALKSNTLIKLSLQLMKRTNLIMDVRMIKVPIEQFNRHVFISEFSLELNKYKLLKIHIMINTWITVPYDPRPNRLMC